jgi:hypothetical protein
MGPLGRPTKERKFMAFKIKKTIDNTDQNYEYFKITRANFDFVNNVLVLEFYAYKSQKARDAGKDPKSYNISFRQETLREMEYLYEQKKVPVIVWESPGVMKVNEKGETVFNWVDHIEKTENVKETVIPNPLFDKTMEYLGKDFKFSELIQTLLYSILPKFPDFAGSEDK